MLQGRHYYLSLGKDDLLFFCWMVLLFGCTAWLIELGVATKGKNVLQEGKGKYESALTIVYMACKKYYMNHAG